ncbi:MAG: GGDEF domain-containing protein [Pseudomonadales bacterium]|nr:GGDEF domain-containing protein [Pseudomonadales bacterium]
MELDPRTFIFTTTLAAFVMMIVFSVQARSFPESIKGFKTWGFALLVATLASALIAARGFIPDLLSVVLGNGFLGLSISLMVAAISIFLDRPVPWKLLLICVVFIMLGMIYSLAPGQGQQIRTMFASTGNIVLLSVAAWVALSGRNVLKFQFGVYFVSICAGTSALVCFARLMTLLAGDEGYAGLLTESPMQRIYLATYSLNVLLVSIGFSIMGHEKLVESYQDLASHDELTGLYNRRRFTEAAEQEIQRAQRYERDISLILIDIDNFKAINDTYGHQAGDKVIKDIAEVMCQNFRETDLFGRYGGEEFIALLPETQLPDAAALSERMRGALIQRTVTFENKEITYTASFGVTHGQPGMPLDQLVGQADKALYHAKNSGRNRVEIFPVVVEVVS